MAVLGALGSAARAAGMKMCNCVMCSVDQGPCRAGLCACIASERGKWADCETLRCASMAARNIAVRFALFNRSALA
jgi:hypothetical protein